MPFITKLGAVAARAYGWIATTVSAAVNDTYFYLVALLLPGNGTNGAQNNTFLDSSTNNFTITRNGNTTQGTFSPFSQTGWSNYFDGSGDYLTLANNAALDLSSGDFTIEGWFYSFSTSGIRPIITRFNGNYATGSDFQYNIYTSGTSLIVRPYSGVTDYTITVGTITANTWNHVSLVRTGNTFYGFLNGVRAATSQTITGSLNTGTWLTYTGGVFSSTLGNDYFYGYLSNLRIVKGVALYTNAFTPPATPLTAVSGTSLLTCQSNRIVDNSANNFTITRNGDVAVQAFSPFVPNNISPTSYSGWFDGSGDYLSLADSSAWTLGTNNFTIEFWINFLASDGSVQNIAGQSGSLGDYSNQSFVFYRDANNKINGYVISGGATAYTCTSTASVTQNTWRHVALVRNNNTLTLYLDGSANGTANLTGVTVTNSSSALSIGRVGDYATSPINGYISNFRLVNGTAVYTSNFTPPTVPLTAIANTSLLTCQNATFIDNSTNAFAITVNGNAQPITTNPFQTPSPNPISYSGYFDGTGDYLSIASNAAFNFGTGDFTIEFWLFLSSPSTTQVFLDIRNAGVGLVFYSSGGVLYVNKDNSGSVLITGGSLTGSTWLHIALSRSSGANKLFINGAQSGSTATDSTNYPTNPVYIGGNFSGGQLTTGYISNLRVVKGTALYTANFIPSNTPLTAVSGTSLLTCQDNRFVDNSTNAFAITVNGNTTPVITNPYGYATPISSTAYSGAFDGSGDYLTIPSNAALTFGTGDFCYEFWVFHAVSGVVETYADQTANGFGFAKNTANKLELAQSGVAVIMTSVGTVPINQWVHVAVTRSGTSVRMFINGTLDSTATLATNFSAASVWYVSRQALAAVGYITGYISNLRAVKGTAVYTAAFTPSTTPLTAIANTSLLTCQNIVFADNSSNAFTITVNGNAATTPVNPFGYSAPATPTSVSYSALTNGGSGYFDGTGDYLSAANNAAFDFGTGDFTVEFWLYALSLTNLPSYVGKKTSDATSGWQIYTNDSANPNKMAARLSLANDFFSTTNITKNSWDHWALTRSGSTVRWFLNGKLDATGTSSANLTDSAELRVGQSQTWGYFLYGYLSSLRIIKGTALYTAAFAPPVLPLTAVSNTQLLLNYTNAGIYDAASQNVLETVGNAQISTAQSKWGGGSMAFDGTGDYLYQPNQVNLQFRTGPYTIEFWIYPNSFSPLPVILDMRTVNAATGGAIQIYITTGGVVTVYGGSSTGTLLVTAGSALSTGVWAHVALTRSGTSTRLFINGTQSGSTATDSTDYGLGALWLGVIASGNNSYFNGYIDDLRITKFARYTANFTPPTAAFPTQ